jgi:hypothetical protein
MVLREMKDLNLIEGVFPPESKFTSGPKSHLIAFMPAFNNLLKTGNKDINSELGLIYDKIYGMLNISGEVTSVFD